MSQSESQWNPYDPAVGDLIGDGGEPFRIEVDGQTWTFGFADQAARDRMEKLVFEAELKIVQSQKSLGILTAEEYERRCDKLAQQAAERAFVNGGPLWLKHAVSVPGMVLWVRALLMAHHPNVTKDQVEKLLETDGPAIRAVLAAIVPPFFAWTFDLAARLVEQAELARVPDAGKMRAEIEKAKAAVKNLRFGD